MQGCLYFHFFYGGYHCFFGFFEDKRDTDDKDTEKKIVRFTA